MRPASARPPTSSSSRRASTSPLVLVLVLGALLALPLAGCGFFAPSVAVKKTGAAEVYASLNANILNADELSSATREILHAYSLTEQAEDDPRAALAALHARAVVEPIRVNLFALSELAFLLGEQERDRDAYLASAVYAWLYLFSTADPQPPNRFDRRFRWACDLYNSALQQALSTPGDEQVVLEAEDRSLPVGRLRVDVDWSHFPFTPVEYTSFVPGDQYLIEGLSLRMRDSGLGVPLIGIPAFEGLGKTPVAALLRVDGEIADLEAGLQSQLEVYSVFDAQQAEVGDGKVPLESDVSVTLAYSLHESPIWKLSLSGLFEGSQAVKENRLLKIRPYQPGRIPVVFVHGTASNPAYWAEMFNTLLGDPVLRQRTQFWFYQYASGNPILYSAAGLREQLRSTIAEVDPDGKDAALQQMVLIGHSQGGLVVKLMLVDGSTQWIEEALGKPLKDLHFNAEQMALINRVYDIKPSPSVTRAVFVCTPQRGSFQAAAWYSRIIAKFISMPGEIQGLGDRLFSENVKLPAELAGRLPTSLDNMNPTNPMLLQLGKAAISPRVTCHSIIAIGEADEHDPQALAEADDGVVEYSSAHIEGVESELLVHASHSCQDNPVVIQEIRRILHEHLERLP